MSQGWNRKNIFNLPQVTNKCWTLWPCIGPKAEKRIPSNLGSQFVTLVGTNILACISNLGPKNKPKMLKIGPKFFWALKSMPNGISKMSCTILWLFLIGQHQFYHGTSIKVNLKNLPCLVIFNYSHGILI
jgi:hypothetical protein